MGASISAPYGFQSTMIPNAVYGDMDIKFPTDLFYDRTPRKIDVACRLVYKGLYRYGQTLAFTCQCDFDGNSVTCAKSLPSGQKFTMNVEAIPTSTGLRFSGTYTSSSPGDAGTINITWCHMDQPAST